MRTADKLDVSDLSESHVWEYVNDDEEDERAVRPVRTTPVECLGNRLVGTHVTLANGARVWAILGNADTRDPRATRHFLTMRIERSGKWFDLARYHDFHFETNGPLQLAAFLGLAVDQVFPISYDLRPYAKGMTDALVGMVTKEPAERLSRADIVDLALQRLDED
jgi:hypothetical protein